MITFAWGFFAGFLFAFLFSGVVMFGLMVRSWRPNDLER